jgi:hypothetical protein
MRTCSGPSKRLQIRYGVCIRIINVDNLHSEMRELEKSPAQVG